MPFYAIKDALLHCGRPSFGVLRINGYFNVVRIRLKQRFIIDLFHINSLFVEQMQFYVCMVFEAELYLPDIRK